MPNSVYRCIFGGKIFSKISRFSALSRKLASCHTSRGLFAKIFFAKGISEHFRAKIFHCQNKQVYGASQYTNITWFRYDLFW